MVLSKKTNTNQTYVSPNVSVRTRHASVITKKITNRIGRHLLHQGPQTRLMNQDEYKKSATGSIFPATQALEVALIRNIPIDGHPCLSLNNQK